jgi:phenylacetic acid degradation operon negative regulatory protein
MLVEDPELHGDFLFCRLTASGRDGIPPFSGSLPSVTLFRQVLSISNTTTRALSARSIVASTLLGCHPPELPVRALVQIGELFGVAEGTIRVALSRMLSTGEIEVVDGRYRLTGGQLLSRQARQDEGWHPPMERWDGTWEMAVVTTEGRSAAERAELRLAMNALRLAELREGVWMRPANLDSRRQRDARAVVDAQCRSFTTRPSDDEQHGRRLAGELWDLVGWARGAQQLRRELGRLVGRLEAGDPTALAPSSLVSAAVLRHFVADALLPAALLPERWPGDVLRAEYDRFDAALRRLLQKRAREHHRESR